VITNNQSSSASDVNKNILQFLFVFLILITSWIIYTSDMSVLPIETRLVTLLNVVLLMLVAIFPYLFDQAVSAFNSSGVQNYASMLFTGDYTGTLVIMAIFAHIIAQEEEHLVDGEIMIRFRRARNRLGVLAVLLLVSLAVPWDWLFLGVQIRLLIWIIPIISFWVNRVTHPPSRYVEAKRQVGSTGPPGT
jgi:uncharacterized membrane protein